MTKSWFSPAHPRVSAGQWTAALAGAGAKLVVTARRVAELAAIAESVGALAIPGDLTSEDHRRQLVAETLDRHGRIDVLINNAGTAASAPAIDTTLDDFRDMLDADLASVFALTQLVGGAMIEAGRGSIINIASLGAERVLDRYTLDAYNAAKAGVVAMTRNLAAEWGRLGVRVNAVGPAFFPTRLSGFLEDPEQVAWIEHHSALGRAGRIDELDGSIIFLASHASSYITGQHLLGLPPLDRTPVYAACLLCQNSSNSLGDM
jgi:NAD(P)-dependent dehydrogenase (short-subunit alcohol dehydrogenase family)